MYEIFCATLIEALKGACVLDSVFYRVVLRLVFVAARLRLMDFGHL